MNLGPPMAAILGGNFQLHKVLETRASLFGNEAAKKGITLRIGAESALAREEQTRCGFFVLVYSAAA